MKYEADTGAIAHASTGVARVRSTVSGLNPGSLLANVGMAMQNSKSGAAAMDLAHTLTSEIVQMGAILDILSQSLSTAAANYNNADAKSKVGTR